MITQLDKAVAQSIRDLVTRMHGRLKRQVSNPEQMSIAELNVIGLLMNEGNLAPSELCERLKISSQFMSQVLKRLAGLGFISRKPSPEDKRKSFVLLTKKGKMKIDDTRQEREEWLANLIAKHYTGEDKKAILKAVELLLILPEL
jgi:DNA-binding MarR family transcriptional regulator